MKLTNQEILGDMLASARMEKGYSQRKLSSITGISNTEISKLEKGERIKPQPDILKKLSNALEIDYEELLEVIGYISDPVFDDNRNMLTESERKFIAEAIMEKWEMTDNKSELPVQDPKSIYRAIFNNSKETDTENFLKEIPLKLYNPVKMIYSKCDDKQLNKFISLCNWFLNNELK